MFCLFKMVIFYIFSLPEGIYTDILWLPMVQAVSSWYFFQSVHLFEHNPDSGLIELLRVSEPLETTQKALLWTNGHPTPSKIDSCSFWENRKPYGHLRTKKINHTGLWNVQLPKFLKPCHDRDLKWCKKWPFAAPWPPLPVDPNGCFWSGS